jgi:type I restriction enzyme S subunit
LIINDGYRAKNKELDTSGLPFLRVSNLTQDGFRWDNVDFFPVENLDRVGIKISRPGDVVLTTKGTIGRFAFVDKHTPQFVYSPQISFWRVIDPETIDPRFLHCWIRG